ncbi:hypothetical protein DFH28DRAFT_1105697 [Melampsora americana]|nr:hypothetical protein DFH28DRAFT_1105697 [Melampsora americana]
MTRSGETPYERRERRNLEKAIALSAIPNHLDPSKQDKMTSINRDTAQNRTKTPSPKPQHQIICPDSQSGLQPFDTFQRPPFQAPPMDSQGTDPISEAAPSTIINGTHPERTSPIFPFSTTDDLREPGWSKSKFDADTSSISAPTPHINGLPRPPPTEDSIEQSVSNRTSLGPPPPPRVIVPETPASPNVSPSLHRSKKVRKPPLPCSDSKSAIDPALAKEKKNPISLTEKSVHGNTSKDSSSLAVQLHVPHDNLDLSSAGPTTGKRVRKQSAIGQESAKSLDALRKLSEEPTEVSPMAAEPKKKPPNTITLIVSSPLSSPVRQVNDDPLNLPSHSKAPPITLKSPRRLSKQQAKKPTQRNKRKLNHDRSSSVSSLNPPTEIPLDAPTLPATSADNSVTLNTKAKRGRRAKLKPTPSPPRESSPRHLQPHEPHSPQRSIERPASPSAACQPSPHDAQSTSQSLQLPSSSRHSTSPAPLSPSDPAKDVEDGTVEKIKKGDPPQLPKDNSKSLSKTSALLETSKNKALPSKKLSLADLIASTRDKKPAAARRVGLPREDRFRLHRHINPNPHVQKQVKKPKRKKRRGEYDSGEDSSEEEKDGDEDEDEVKTNKNKMKIEEEDVGEVDVVEDVANDEEY